MDANWRIHGIYLAVIIALVLVVVLLWWPSTWRKVVGHGRKQRAVSPCSLASAQVQLPVLRAWTTRSKEIIAQSMRDDIVGDKMRELCTYALDGGKKLRAAIVLALVNQYKPTVASAAEKCALCIEYIHCASLILDDIMDNDEERRGKMATHVKYGVTTAQLAATQLISVGIMLIGDAVEQLKQAGVTEADADYVGIQMVSYVSRNMKNLCLGQYVDVFPKEFQSVDTIESEIKQSIDSSSHKAGVEHLIQQKTGTLFEVSFVFGWLLSHPEQRSPDNLRHVEATAKDFGLLFQIADDLDDIEQDSGKEGSFNFALRFGVTTTKRYCAGEIGTRWDQQTRTTGLNCNVLLNEMYQHLQETIAQQCHCYEQIGV
jgi:geranylgeranyl diphosphate synthase, type II